MPSAFWDWLPTFAELAELPAPARSDGVSLVPTLLGIGEQQPTLIYIEYSENGKTPNYAEFANDHRGRVRKQMQAIRVGDFMGVRYNTKSHADRFEIYNVVSDPQQTNNLAGQSRYGPLQQQMKDKVLRVRRPSGQARRPYDNKLVPPVHSVDVIPGVQWRSYEKTLPWVAKLDDLEPSSTGNQKRPDVTKVLHDRETGVLCRGYIEAPVDGEYTFYLTANNRALLRLHEATVIDADFGYEPGSEASGTIRLQSGKHPFRLYFARGVAEDPTLSLSWSRAEQPKQKIPASVFSCHSEPTKEQP